jgi:hypothetical protein
MRRSFVALVGAVGLTGCVGAGGASFEQLRARATFDLQCPAPSTQFFDLDERTKGVRGCGKQMTYVEVCDNRPDGWHCTWVLNAPAWFVAPARVPPRPDGTWWWTEPRGSAAPAPRAPESPAPIVPPAPPPLVSPPPAVPVRPLPLEPIPPTSAAPTSDASSVCAAGVQANVCPNRPPMAWPVRDRGF